MSQEERRAAIVEATIPLLLADATDLSTATIAQAAGIAEGTVFRAFRDKKELVLTCAMQALAADREVESIQRIDPSRSLAERLTEAVDVLGGYLDRIWRVMRAMHTAGVEWDRKPEPHKHGEQHKDGPIEMRRVGEAIAALITSGDEPLRADAPLAARLLLGLVFTNRRGDLEFGTESASSKELVDLFLHGVLDRHAGTTTDMGEDR